ncbi:hypothetical protein KUCAC02_036142, partial [Chaenocephalus aceratus]
RWLFEDPRRSSDKNCHRLQRAKQFVSEPPPSEPPEPPAANLDLKEAETKTLSLGVNTPEGLLPNASEGGGFAPHRNIDVLRTWIRSPFRRGSALPSDVDPLLPSDVDPLSRQTWIRSSRQTWIRSPVRRGSAPLPSDVDPLSSQTWIRSPIRRDQIDLQRALFPVQEETGTQIIFSPTNMKA